MNRVRRILVLARRDHAEAMRVAAGLTIFGHKVDLVFVDREVEDTPANAAQAELLELAEIEPVSTIDQDGLTRLDPTDLAALLAGADSVVSI